MSIPSMPVWRLTVVSPSDVAAEKACIHGIVLELNRQLEKSKTPAQIRVYEFESDVPAGLHKDGPQGLADKYLPLEECDYVIGIFWKRFGTPTLDSLSGTEHELRKARRAFEKRGAPDVLLYFKTEPFLPTSLDEIDQYRQVMAFKEEFSHVGRYRPFRDIQDFKAIVSGDLWTSIHGNTRLKPASTLAPTQLETSEAPLMSVSTTSLMLRDRGITELLPEIQISLTSSNKSVPSLPSKFDFLIAFNTNFTGQLQPGQHNVVLLRLTYSDGNTLLVPAEMTGLNTVRINSVVVNFLPGISSQTFKIGNLRVNASAIGTGGLVFATVVLLDAQGEMLSSSVVECGSIASSLDVVVHPTSGSSFGSIDSPILMQRALLRDSAKIPDVVTVPELSFRISFTEGFAGVFRSREGESDNPYQWVTHGTRLRAAFLVPSGFEIFVTVYSMGIGDADLISLNGGARLVSAGGSESRRFWNNPLYADDARLAIQRLPKDEASGSVVAVWEWSGNMSTDRTCRRATFGVVVAANDNPGRGFITLNGDLGPISAVIVPASDPIPRFVPAGHTIIAAGLEPPKNLVSD